MVWLNPRTEPYGNEQPEEGTLLGIGHLEGGTVLKNRYLDGGTLMRKRNGQLEGGPLL